MARNYIIKTMSLLGKYYCPIVPELGHYPNEGKWAYEKIILDDNKKSVLLKCYFDTEEERDEAYKKDFMKMHNFAKEVLEIKNAKVLNKTNKAKITKQIGVYNGQL